MKKILTLFTFAFLFQNSFSQNYYYCEGSKIELSQRLDKIAVILNTNSYSKDYLSNTLKSISGFNNEIKETAENVFLINFPFKKSIEEIQNQISLSSTKSNLIKFITPVYFGESKRVTQIPTDEFIVGLKNINDKKRLDLLNLQNNVSIIGTVGDEKYFLLKSNSGVSKNALELSSVYYSTEIFEFAEPNFVYPEFCLLNSIPNDPNFGQQWSLRNTGQTIATGELYFGDQPSVNGIPGADMDVDIAWDITTGSPSVKIGIVDTGIDSTHPDFQAAGHILPGYDAFYNKNSVPRDSGFHGTGSAGFIGAVMNNLTGVAGIAPECKIMSLRIYNANGSATISSIVRAFDTARVRGIDILTNGWGAQSSVTSITNAINNAALNGRGGLGCIIFFAAGNDGFAPVIYPSRLSNVISVGGSTTHDQKKASGNGNQYYWGSNFGEDASGDLDAVAPANCYTTDVQGTPGYSTGNYNPYFWGTSCSCPSAAGVAALVLSVNTSQTRLQLIENLLRGCDKIDNAAYSVTKTYGKWNDYTGYGRLNAYNSVKLASGIDVTPPSINHKNISSLTSTYPTVITAEIIDHDGSPVPSSGANQPKLFFRINKNNSGWSAFDSLVASSFSANNFFFKIPCQGYETQVQYYIRAKDNSGNTASFPRGAPNPFWLCYFTVGNLTTSSNKINSFTADDATVTLSPTVNFGNFIILDTKVTIYLRHTNVSDDMFEIYSPSADANNNRKCIFSANGNGGQNITGATVTDSAPGFWNAGSPPYSNQSYKGDYLLNGFAGTNANGNWKLLNLDYSTGDVPYFDSVRITFTKTTGALSPCARLNNESDSIINFGTVNYGDTVVKNFYLKNSGTANLIVSGVNFSGMFASRFSLVNSVSSAIIPNDSALLIVKLNSSLLNAANKGKSSESIEDAVMNIATNDPGKPNFRVSLQSENNLPAIKFLRTKFLIQGFYNYTTDTMIPDTITTYLRNNFAPYSIVDSANEILNSSGEALLNFKRLANGINYYIQLKHRNTVQTWSSSPGQAFFNDTLIYDFLSDSSTAFGNNQIRIDDSPVRYAIYNGDVNQDGSIDISDLSLIDNDAAGFTTGYTPTDLNGDDYVDLGDMTIADNNATGFVAAITP